MRCGALGDAATFSFFPTKNLPCFGDGGLITTPSAEVDRMSRVLRFHGSEDKRTFTHVGYNSRLDELQAAILLELRPLVDGWNDGRIAVAARYEELGLGEHVVLPAVAAGARHVYHLYIVRSQERERLVARPHARRASATCVYYSTPLHRQPVFAHLGYAEGSLPVTERCARECLALPMSPTLGEAAQREVVRRRHGPVSRQNVDFLPNGAVEPPPAVAGRRRRAPDGRSPGTRPTRSASRSRATPAGTPTGSRRS